MSTKTGGFGAAAAVDAAFQAVHAPLALLAGMELDLFSALEGAPAEPSDLARRLGLDGGRLERLLAVLALEGWLVREGPRYRNAPRSSEALVRGRPGSLAGMERLQRDLIGALLETATSIRSGRPGAHHDFARMDPGELEAFFEGLHPTALAAGSLLFERGLLAGARRLLDLGGGSGGLAIRACELLPGLEATVLELPGVAGLTRRKLREAGLEARIEIREGDATAPVEGPFDLVVLRAVLQVLSLASARQVLYRAFQALEPGGRLLVLSRALDDDRLGPEESLRFDLVLLNVYEEGRTWTDAEHRAWMEAAGFEAVERELLPGGTSLFRARRPG